MFQLTIETDNAAFAEDDGTETTAALCAEVARILREVAGRLAHVSVTESESGPCHDVNGNKVGTWRLT